MAERTKLGRRTVTAGLDLFVLKPLSLFIWWFSHRANTIEFRDRQSLLDRTQRALAAGRPVLFASNHVSWFDDPVVPMALYRTGQRSGLECLGVLGVGALSAVLLPGSLWLLPTGIAAVAIAWRGANKVWWTLGDFVNLSDAAVLRNKMVLVHGERLGRTRRAVLAFCDWLIPAFMRTPTVRTVFVDRRPGEEALEMRARAIETTIDIAARPEPVWLFFEGGRTKVPGTIAPARRGIGALVVGLRARGLDPLVIVVYHDGMERLIPPGAARFLSYGHHVAVLWRELDVDAAEAAGHRSAEALAECVRDDVIALQAGLRAERGSESRDA